MDVYLATCVAGNKAVSEEGYQKYIGSTYINYAYNNTNVQKIFDRYIELKGKIDDAQAVLEESKIIWDCLSRLSMTMFTNRLRRL